jgi:hypothetical protein
MEFEKIVYDYFDRDLYSRNGISLLGNHHVSALETIPDPPIPASQIAITKTLFLTFQAAMGLLATKSAQQMGGTITRAEAGELALAFISRKEGLVKSEFGKGSAAYTEFYPAGITEYHDATVEGFRALLTRYFNSAVKYKTQLGEAFCTEIENLQEQYNEARDEQSGGIAGNKSAQSQVREARKALTMQLTRNVLNIAATCVDNPEAFGKWFNFGLLEVANNHNGGENTPEPPPGGGN